MKLLKRKVYKDGRYYIDLFLCWVYEGKHLAVRIEPTFASAKKCLFANAQEIGAMDDLTKFY